MGTLASEITRGRRATRPDERQPREAEAALTDPARGGEEGARRWRPRRPRHGRPGPRPHVDADHHQVRLETALAPRHAACTRAMRAILPPNRRARRAYCTTLAQLPALQGPLHPRRHERAVCSRRCRALLSRHLGCTAAGAACFPPVGPSRARARLTQRGPIGHPPGHASLRAVPSPPCIALRHIVHVSQAPLSRFGDTAANAGMLALLETITWLPISAKAPSPLRAHPPPSAPPPRLRSLSRPLPHPSPAHLFPVHRADLLRLVRRRSLPHLHHPDRRAQDDAPGASAINNRLFGPAISPGYVNRRAVHVAGAGLARHVSARRARRRRGASRTLLRRHSRRHCLSCCCHVIGGGDDYLISA